MVLLLIFVTLDPKFTSLLFVGDDLIQTLDSVVQLSLGEIESFLNTHLLGLKSGSIVRELIDLLILLFDLDTSLVKHLVFHVDDVRETLVTIMLVLQLGFDFVSSFVHSMEFVYKIVMVSRLLNQLLLLLLIVDRQGAKLEFKLIFHQFCCLQVVLELFDLSLSISINLTEADHFTLVALELAGGVL